VDEKFSVAQATGTAGVTVGVPTSPARQGFGPELHLSYDSGAGNGPFGLGWQLVVPAVTRKTSKGLPRYGDADDTDVVVLSGAEDLVPLLVPPASPGDPWTPDTFSTSVGATSYEVRRYRPRVEGAFSRIERWQATATGDVHWRTTTRGNVTSLFGQDPTSRITDPDDLTRVFSWLLDLSYDAQGNAISYVYKAEDAVGVPAVASEGGRVVTANRYLKRVLYGNEVPYDPTRDTTLPTTWDFQLVLDYGEHDLNNPLPAEALPWLGRPDPFSSYRSGFEVRTYRTCRRFLMFHQFPTELGTPSVVVRSLDLAYSLTPDGSPATADLPAYSFLGTVTQTGWLLGASGYETAALPPLELHYAPLQTGPCQTLVDPDSLQNLLGDAGSSRHPWVDLDGEGLKGLLTEDDTAWYYKRNLSAWNPDGSGPSARFGPLELVAEKPVGKLGGRTQLTSLNGDGHLAAVRLSPPSAGYYERGGIDTGASRDGFSEGARAWAPFRMLSSSASIDWTSPNLRLVDLDGDGLADVLLTEDEVITWYRFVPYEGFSGPGTVRKPTDEDAGPALMLADGTGSIYLADMSGDGLSDLVRVRNGEVCYWPNLGYGRFGAKVTMDAAPWFDKPDCFDQKRLRLADVDGTGTADLVYFGSATTSIFFNQSGNSWTSAYDLSQFPPVDDTATADVLDLLGTGTSCLVWTSPLPADAVAPLRYIDLTSSQKPYLLARAVNNLGAETSVTYAPSTTFYVQDAALGNPWVTSLPFPVHVVSRVQVDEKVTRTSVVSTYSYHHGYYDGVEREFRGFARVDQYDTDVVPIASGTGLFTETPTVEGDEFALPPVWTRTWFHTGAWFGEKDIAARLASEYYQGDPLAPQLGTTQLDAGLSDDEARDACRALRGRVLRQEVFGEDGSPASVHPYTTTEHRYLVMRLQPPVQLPVGPGDGPDDRARTYGAWLAYELETLSSSYERAPDDPRVAHALTLEVDGLGNPVKVAQAAYPRRIPAFPEQGVTIVTYTEHDVVNVTDQADWYRVGVPCETRQFELTGIVPGGALFDPAGLLSSAADAMEIPYEAVPDGTAQKRLYGRSRTLYLADDLSTALPSGQVASLGLVDARYELAATVGLLAGAFAPHLTGAAATALLIGPGGYLDLDGDGNLWKPSPRAFYSSDPSAPDPVFAAAHFFLPQGSIDPFGNVARAGYDGHNLLVVSTTDPVGNATAAQHNYRVLRPWLITDPNLNRSGVRYDALCMVVATAAMGKLVAGVDEGDHLDTTTAEVSATDDPTTRLDYDLGAYRAWASDPSSDPDHPVPNWSRALARVQHKDPTSAWIEAYDYSDGLGRVVLSKVQAEPGPAPQRDGPGRLQHTAQGGLVIQQTTARWVGSGRVVPDNKGNPVKAYEPFFDSSPTYDDETDLVDWGVTAITRYDPLSRVIRLDQPDGAYRTVDLGPWQVTIADENDTVLSSAWYAARQANQLGPVEAAAAAKAATHAATPTVLHLDPLGRTFRSIADNGTGGQYATTVSLDVAGHVLATTDALGRVILVQDYDVAGTEFHHRSVDAGEGWMLTSCDGKPMEHWDGRDFDSVQAYDALRRPTTFTVTGPSQPERVAEELTYGESLFNAEDLNLRGALYQHRDEAGIATTAQRDFEGNVLSATRQLLADPTLRVDWSASPALDPETFSTRSTYDALNRVITATSPDGSVTTPTYNQRNLVTATSVDLRGSATATAFLTSVSFDAKGRRLAASYANGVTLAFQYDPETFRLRRLQSVRGASPANLQDLSYTYDPVGNVTHLADAAQQTVFFANQVVTPDADYTYDPIYRLIEAQGREQIGLASSPQTTWDDGPRVAVPSPADGQAMRAYTERYGYDDVGNLTSLAHAAGTGSWTRTYAYDEPTVPPATNQLTSTTVGAVHETYAYDQNGNCTAMPQLSLMAWDWKNELEATATQIVSQGAAPTTYYRYDAGGQRVRKATVAGTGGTRAERIYLGPYEVYREYAAGVVALERQCLHVGSGTAVVALVETTTVDSAAAGGPLPPASTRYQLGNLLGSAVLEVDPSAALLTYEEYYPYGSTSFQTGASAAEVSLKRYRYTGKERDLETGFTYCGARYLATWLGRWTSCDPAGLADGPSAYVYARDNPVNGVDPTGTQTNDPHFPSETVEIARAAGYPIWEDAKPPVPSLTGPTIHPGRKDGAAPAPEQHTAPKPKPKPPPKKQEAAAAPVDDLPFLKAYAEAATTPHYSPIYYRITGTGSLVLGSIEVVVGVFTSELAVGVPVAGHGFLTVEAATEQVISGAPQRTLLARGTTAGASRLGADPRLAWALGETAQVTSDIAVAGLSLRMSPLSITEGGGGALGIPGRGPLVGGGGPSSLAGITDDEINAALDLDKGFSPNYYRTPVSVSEQAGRTSLDDLVPVSRWGWPGLRPGDWVMPGDPTFKNFVLSGKWGPEIPAKPIPDWTLGQAFMVPESSVQYPGGIVEWFIKGLIWGQRKFIP